MKRLTARQVEVLELIQDATLTLGTCPSIRELGECLNIKSLRGVTNHLDALERKGYIQRLPSTSRGIYVRRDSSGKPVRLAYVEAQ